MGMFGKGGDLARWSQAQLKADPLGMAGAAPWQTVAGAVADNLGGAADLVNGVANYGLGMIGAKYRLPTGVVQAAVPQPKARGSQVARAALGLVGPGGELTEGEKAVTAAAQTMRNLKWGDTAAERLMTARRAVSATGGNHPEALAVAHQAADELGLPRIEHTGSIDLPPFDLSQDPSWRQPNANGAPQMLDPARAKAQLSMTDPGTQAHADALAEWQRASAEHNATTPAPQIVAYHGSPAAPFDAFSNEAIGSGEGAAAYGHGHYFAQNPDVARSYRDALIEGTGDLQYQGRPIGAHYNELMAAADRAPMPQGQQLYDRMAVLDNLMNKGDVLGVHDVADQHGPEAMGWFNREVAPTFDRNGSLYQVGINANPDHFLDWDAGLHRQTPHVQDALRQLGFNADPAAMQAHDSALMDALTGDGSTEIPRAPADPSGGEIYGKLQVSRGGSWTNGGPAASDALAQAGIPGIRYSDAGSRGNSGGTSNFVVFDPSTVDILKRYAAPGMIGAGGAAWGASQLPSDQDATPPASTGL